MPDAALMPLLATEAHSDDRPVLLLIDDDSMVGRFIGHAAEECGYRAIRTSGVESFRRHFHEVPAETVAVDLGVPGCDGIDIIRFLAEEKYRGLVIIISGLERRILEAAGRLGSALGLRMAEPLPKPFRFEELERRLRPELAGAEL